MIFLTDNALFLIFDKIEVIRLGRAFIDMKAAIESRKINIARIWSKYEGQYERRAGIIMGLDPQRYRTICIYLAKNSKNPNFLEQKGYKTIYILENQSLQRFNFMLVWKLVKIIKKEKIDILHCHQHKSTVYGTMAAMIARTPVVIAHVRGLGRTRNWQRRFKNLFFMKKVNKILTVGEAVRNDVLKNNICIPTEKVYSLGNSIDYRYFADVAISKADAKRMLGVPSDAFVFGTVARLVPTKGLSYLIEAFPEVKKHKRSAHLVLLGDGRCRSELEKQASNMFCRDSIHFLGYRENIEQLLRGMDVFVLPSVAEGFGLALAEAMAAGVPCIATEVGGIPEITNGTEAGILVPPRDSAELAKAMINTVSMPRNELAQLVDNAQNRVRHLYSHEKVCQKLMIIYENELRTSTRLR